jgi:outer membrane protein assembly factor BamB
MRRLIVSGLALSLLASLLPVAVASAEAPNWPMWRGPEGTGKAEGKDLPVEWSGDGKNIAWRLDLPGRSAATPAVWGDKVFAVTPEGDAIFLWCVSLAEGKPLWKAKVSDGNQDFGFGGKKKNNHCTPSPTTDGKHVWVMAGGLKGKGGDLVCFDLDGKEVWRRNIQKDHAPFTHLFGYANTPLLYEGLLYVPLMQEHGPSFLLAVDAATGKDVWKTPREDNPAEKESKDAYGSPAVLKTGDKTEIVLCGADLVTAYDPKTGKENWRSGGVNDKRNSTLRIICSPVAAGGLVYAVTAKSGPMLVIRGGGSGDVEKTHRAWTRDRDMPDQSSPAVADGLVYVVRENGVLTVLDAATGKEHYSKRVTDKGHFSPSPVVADGKVYLQNEQGVCVVMAAGTEFKVLGVNNLNNEFTLASPVVIGDSLLIRTEKALYKIRGK